MSNLVSPATTTEGFGYGNLRFQKKVTIVDETKYDPSRSNNGGAYSFEKELYYFHGTHPNKGVFGYWRIAYESNCSEFTTDSNGVFCDYIRYLNFGSVNGYELPLFKVQFDPNWEEGGESSANLFDYLSEVTDEEFFFAKDCILYTEEDIEKVSWKLTENEGYHE